MFVSRLPNPHLPEMASVQNKKEPSTVDSLGFMRPGCSIDPELEREIALKQLQELPTKRKTRDLVTEHIDYKRIAIKVEPLTPQQLALKQLEEIQIRKPRAEYIHKEIPSKKCSHPKFKSKLKLQVKVNSAKPKVRDFIKKEAANQVSRMHNKPSKGVGKPNVQSCSTKKPLNSRVSPRKREAAEIGKTRMSSRLAH